MNRMDKLAVMPLFFLCFLLFLFLPVKDLKVICYGAFYWLAMGILLPVKDLKVICYGAFYWLAMGIQSYPLLLFLLREICPNFNSLRLKQPNNKL